MRQLKRALCSLMSLVMLLGLVPTSALAAPPYEGDHNGTITVSVRDVVADAPLAGSRVQLEDITAGREHNYGTLTTDANGSVSWTDMSSGWYRITQTTVPNGYILNSEEIVRYFDTEQNATLPIEIANRTQTALYIYRIDPATQLGLKGATYIVTDNTGAQVAAGETAENGYLIIPHIEAGDYTITETRAPNGYNISTQPQKVTIVETGDDPFIALFTGAEKSSITIFNYDGATGAPIAGSSWSIKKADGSVLADKLTTNSGGLVSLSNLEPGTYIITETAVAPGYIKELKHADVTIGQKSENRVVSLSNIKPGNITIHVGDSVTGRDLSGCAFSLYNERNQVVQGPKTSNANGLVTFENVDDGHYTVVSTPASGYVMDVSTQAVSITHGGDKLLNFTATPMGSILIRAVDEMEPTKMLTGCEFEVRKMDGTLVGSSYTTGADGTVLVSHLDNGYYVISETRVTAGYVMESVTKTVYVEAGTVTPVTFSHRDRPYIVVQCYVKGTTTPIPGSQVSLSGSNGETVMTGTVGSDGTYTFENLEPGTYTVKYVDATTGYTIDTPTQTVVVEKTKAGLATLFASRHSAIIITKLDDKSQAPLAGATFLVRDSSGTVVDRVTTDANGTAVTKILTPGRYTLHEMFAPDGYVATTDSTAVEVKNNQTTLVTCTNQKKSAVVVYAYDKDGMPMGNISYILYNAVTGKEIATKLTNEAGVATFEQLDPGIYMVSESVVPDGYVVVNQTQSRIVVTADEASFVRFVHIPEATIKMETVDITTGEAVTGAVYQVTNENGSFTANFTTDENGEAYTETLAIGTYYVKQVQAPDGYLMNTTTQTIEVLKDRVNLAKFFNKSVSRIVVECVVSGENFGLQGATITVENEAAKEVARGTTLADGLFTTGELEPGLYTVKVISTPDGYACVQKQRTIEVTTGTASTVKFEFTADNRIIVNLTDASDPTKGLEGSKFRVESTNGDFETDIVTDAAGHATTDVLPNGTYMVHQTAAPTGYILDQSYQWATIDASGTTVLDFTNRRVSGLVIQALTESDHKPIPGVVFEVWEQNGKLIKTVTSDATGLIQVEGLDSGIYLVKEVNVPSGYTARTLTQTVTVSVDTPTTLNFYHTSESVLTINKTDAQTGKLLSGATYRITKANGDYVGDYTTDSSGRIVVSTLAAGTYNVVESAAPSGYLLDTTSKSFTIKDNQPVVLDLTNEPISGLRIVNTCTQDGKPISGNTFKITTYAGVVVGNFTTNSAGLISVSLAPGKYTVYQTYVANGYIRNEEVWNINIAAGVGTTLEVQNERESNVIVHMVDATTGSGIYGVELEIKDWKNNNVGRFKSDNEGNIYLTDVLNEGRYTLSILTVPAGYNKDSVPKTITVTPGQTTEVTWKLQGQQGQVTIITYSGSDSTMMNIRKNSPLAGAVYQITDTTGKVIGTINGDVNGYAYSGALSIGTYYAQQIVAPSGWQVNPARFTFRVSSINDNIRVEVYNLAANYSTAVTVNGQATATAGAQVKYYFTMANNSTSAMSNFFLHLKVPTDAMRANTLTTGTYSGAATTYSMEYKTNMQGYRSLASGLNSKSSYTYGLSTQSLGLQSGEYVTDVRMVFSTVVAGFKTSTAPTLSCYVLSTVSTGYQAIMRAECGAINGYYSNSSNGGVWGNTTGQTVSQNPGVSVDNGWVSSAGQFTTYIYGYAQNVLPGTLPKTGY